MTASDRMMIILLATSNPHKLGEIRAVFDEMGGPEARRVDMVTLEEMNVHAPEPVEDQATFEGNAVLKARYYAKRAQMLCLADDSGLEVDALEGAPGVQSARYSRMIGPRHLVDPANNRRLLEELGDLPVAQRTARFVCAMALCDARHEKPLALVRGVIEGRILGPGDDGYTGDPAIDARGRGSFGFGYDPLFFVPLRDRTTAEMSPAEKNSISHRGSAARQMWLELAKLL